MNNIFNEDCTYSCTHPYFLDDWLSPISLYNKKKHCLLLHRRVYTLLNKVVLSIVTLQFQSARRRSFLLFVVKFKYRPWILQILLTHFHLGFENVAVEKNLFYMQIFAVAPVLWNIKKLNLKFSEKLFECNEECDAECDT